MVVIDGYLKYEETWWDTNSALTTPLLVDYYNPAEYVIQARGIVDNYRGNWQVEISSANNILEADVYLKEGVYEPNPETISAKIKPAPFVLIPTLGERLDFTYSFPDVARCTATMLFTAGLPEWVPILIALRLLTWVAL